MGIPRFFKWVATSPEFETTVQNLNYTEDFPTEIEEFYIDSNSIIHSCISEEFFPDKPRLVPLKTQMNQQDREQKIFKKIIKFIENLIEFVKPKNFVYITIDGVAPLAKQTQQRQRRTKSANDIYRNQLFDRCQITPGTDFLDRFKEYIKKWCEKYSKNIKIYFSSQNVPGEGEHKIIDYIRENPTKKGICMYGIDADLFMLALSTHIFPFYLVREDPSTKDTNRYYYTVDIRLFAEKLWKKYCNKGKIDNFINDFVLISMLVGNDFLPHSPSFYDLETCLPLILETRMQLPGDKYIIENNEINWENLKMLFVKLSKYESNLLIRLTNNIKTFQDTRVNSAYQSGIFDYSKYKKLFYRNAYKSAGFIYKNSQNICNEFLLGLDWVYKYYNGKPKNWQYQYSYHYAPLLKDLSKYLDNNIPEIVSNKVIKPLSQFEQLLCVIPKTSFYLLPKKLQKIPKILREFYPDPNTVKIDTNGIMSEHESIVLLPIINIKLIKNFYNKNKELFSEEEKRLNKREKVLIFNHK